MNYNSMSYADLKKTAKEKGLPTTGNTETLKARLEASDATQTGVTFKSNYSVDKEDFEHPIMGGSVLKETDNFEVVTIDSVKDTTNTANSGYRAYSLDADGKKIVRYLNQGEVLDLAKSVNAYRFNEDTQKYDIDTDKLVLSIKNKELSLAA